MGRRGAITEHEVAEMKKNVFKALFTVILALSFAARAEAAPWWWPAKTSVKTVQLALPTNNGGIVSVTVPSKTSLVKPERANGHRRAQDSAVNRRDDERIAADLERHF
jgi:hypothetical protein